MTTITQHKNNEHHTTPPQLKPTNDTLSPLFNRLLHLFSIHRPSRLQLNKMEYKSIAKELLIVKKNFEKWADQQKKIVQ